MGRAHRFFLYTQHLSGTGHYVRTFEIARALAERHEVYLLDGGRPVPRPLPHAPIKKLTLPRIYRSPEGLAPVDSVCDIDDVMMKRRALLLEFVEQVRPTVLVFEHFPFSKGILTSEIIPVIERARAVDDGVKVVCSVRDILPPTQRDPAPHEHRDTVLNVLHRHFDRVLVHADPKIIRLEEHIPWAGEITVPMIYTGYVSEKPRTQSSLNGADDHKKTDGNFAVLSAGGGGCLSMISQCIKAWTHPHIHSIGRERTLVIFAPLFLPKNQASQLTQQANASRIRLQSFTSNFIDWVKAADLSISQAGYNTCANILETRTPSILIPDVNMSDQLPRARLLSRLGVATMIDPAELNTEGLIQAIRETLTRPGINHDFNLDGARTTSRVLESL